MTQREAIQDLLSNVPRAEMTADFFEAALRGEKPLKPYLHGSWLSQGVRTRIGQFVARPEVDSGTALRYLLLVGDLGRDYISEASLQHLQTWWASHERRTDLLDFSKLWRDMGGQGADWLQAFQERLNRDFAGSYFASRVDPLLGGLGVAGYPKMPSRAWEMTRERIRALKILAWLKPLPEVARPHLWPFALGEARVERELAQAALEGDESGMLKGLRDGAAGPRERAAEWAARARLHEAIPILVKALEKEKVERAKLAQMSALERLGAPLDAFLNRARLQADARKILSKEYPEALDDAPLPTLRWANDGVPVEGDILRGLLVQSMRLKDPQPSAFLICLCKHMEAAGRQAWGLDLVSWWIAKDTKPVYTPQQIDAMVGAKMASTRNFWQQLGITKTNHILEAEVRRELEGTVESAIALKGVLALAGACGGAAVVEKVQAYVKHWYGVRAAQCKALLAMVGHIEALEAVQFLLAVARRFRTKGIQEEAATRLQERAQRLGWSLDDMADLSLPTGGLGADGTLRLDFGGRVIVAQLNPAFHWTLQGYKALPAAGAGDNEELVKTATKQFKQAQKTVKDVQKSLRERLYEAMCRERTWTLDTWQTCLNQHPLARFVCQSLVWLADQQSFRPCEDGTFVDVDNNTVLLAEGVRIQLAHPLLLEATSVSAWQAHLLDYMLIPPFAQLARAPISKDEAADYKGWMLTSFELRNKAKALGYERGSPEDGGVVMEYRKTLGPWVIRVEFSGSALPETLHPTALEGVGFEYEKHQASLPDVPLVLYSEALHDLREMAESGSGYDPDWERKATIS